MIAPLDVGADHPAFAGHFPGFAILPGAALLDEVLHEIARSRSLDLRRWSVASVKFLDIVRPGTTLTLEHTAAAAGVRFVVRGSGGAIASGLLSAVAGPAGADGV